MKNILALTVLFVSSVASAQTPQFAIGGGLIFNKPDFKTGNTSGAGYSVDEESTTTLNIGARAILPLQEKLSFRTGLYLQEKSGKIELEASGISASVTGKILELAIPLNVQYQLHEKFSAYGGYIADFPLNTYCKAGGVISGCPLNEAGKVTHNLNVGGSFHLAEKFDLELSYQHPMKAVLDDLKIYAWLFQGFYKF
ncbi:MAG: outer membrane beta-barrel protein [Bdellovibrionota bacterium]